MYGEDRSATIVTSELLAVSVALISGSWVEVTERSFQSSDAKTAWLRCRIGEWQRNIWQ
jgi:hypothetical protein